MFQGVGFMIVSNHRAAKLHASQSLYYCLLSRGAPIIRLAKTLAADMLISNIEEVNNNNACNRD